MFKNMIKGIVIGGAALTMAVSAQAGTINVNLYGASAQYKFWTAEAPKFLATAATSGGLGCASTDVYSAKTAKGEQDRDAGMAVCLGDTAVDIDGDGTAEATGSGSSLGADTVIIRYTTNASYDGIRAVTADTAYDPDGCGSANRLQASDLEASFAQYPDSGTGIPNLVCQDVHIGASDVAATTFNQTSVGDLFGPLGDDATVDQTHSVVYPDDLQDPGPDGLDYRVDRPIVVPFGFYANNDGTTPVPFDNLSRAMAMNLFSGKVLNWNEFDPDMDSLPVVVCLRHAGSGTAATLDAAVMRGDATLAQAQVKPTDFAAQFGLSPVIWFNKGSSDEMRCVGTQVGAVGYADADKWLPGDDPDPANGDYEFNGPVKKLTYQGVEPNSKTIANGQYAFWAAQWLYSNEGDGSDELSIITKLATFAGDSANMPSSKAEYWAAQQDMVFDKANDFSMPKP